MDGFLEADAILLPFVCGVSETNMAVIGSSWGEAAAATAGGNEVRGGGEAQTPFVGVRRRVMSSASSLAPSAVENLLLVGAGADAVELSAGERRARA